MRWTCFAIFCAWFALATGARADEGWIFGSVVCEGNGALVRFTEYDLDNGPEFQAPPAAYAARFAHATNSDPSQCRLRDGRLVVLRQTYAADGMAWGGPGAGTDTQGFSLSVGDRIVYDDVLSSSSVDRADLVVIFDRGALTVCRTSDDRWHDIPLQCISANDRLPGERLRQGDLRPYYALVSASPDMQSLCSAPLPAEEPQIHPPHNWPTFVSIEPRNSVRIPGETPLPDLHFDIDNDGLIDLPIRVSNEGTGYFDGTFFMLPPPRTSRQHRSKSTLHQMR